MHVLTPTSLLSAVFHLGGGDELQRALAAAAPGVDVRGLSEAELRTATADGPGVVVLCDAPAEVVTRVREVADETGLPRWPVVLCTSTTEPEMPPEVLAPSDWQPAVIARALLFALQEHELRRANLQLRGELLTFGSRVAHDLRTPLGGILTTTEMLREVLAEDAPGHGALAGPIVESAEGLATLIERTSVFAKAVASRAPFERFDMGVAFWNAFQALERRVLQAGATLTQPSSWPRVEGQSAWMETIWKNLLANALQHGGERVRIEAGWAPVDEGNRFWVWDSGTVPEERRATLFYPFHQLHRPDAPRGLGLPIVRRLVELQGGQCAFEAPVSGGSRFSFVLPAAAAVIAPAAIPV